MTSPISQKTKMAPEGNSAAVGVLGNRPFMLLWLAQLSTQVGGNMVIYALTVVITVAYHSSSAISALLLSFLVPAILFSAIAGVLVDRVDKRILLVVTNVLRGLAFLCIFLGGSNLLVLYLLMLFVSTVTTFFGPAEASMIPFLVPKEQLLAANGFFTLTANIAFAFGFALLGPILAAIFSAQLLIVVVAGLYFVAALICAILPPSPPVAVDVAAGQTVADAERAVGTMIGQFREGIAYIRENRNVGWSLTYLGVTGALVGILAILGSGFAQSTLHLGPNDFGLVVVPLGLGVAMGILALNSYGRYLPRRRTIEIGLVAMGALLAILASIGPISGYLQDRATSGGLADASRVVSTLSLVMGIAFLIGAAYVVVAISAQTQLQEELPESVRGRVFGVLNMLVSIASLAPMILVGPLADIVGRQIVIFSVGILVCLFGLFSLFGRRRLTPGQASARSPETPTGAPVDPMTALTGPSEVTVGSRESSARSRLRDH